MYHVFDEEFDTSERDKKLKIITFFLLAVIVIALLFVNFVTAGDTNNKTQSLKVEKNDDGVYINTNGMSQHFLLLCDEKGYDITNSKELYDCSHQYLLDSYQQLWCVIEGYPINTPQDRMECPVQSRYKELKAIIIDVINEIKNNEK